MRIYTMDGQEFSELPAIYANTSPITEAWWEEHGGTIEEVPDPMPVDTKVYSKYKLMLACKKENLWSEVKSYIEQAGKWESFLLIQDISSDNDELQQVMPTIIQAFGEETVARVLAEAEI